MLVGAELENIDQDCLEYLERILNDTNKNGEGSGSVGHENASLGCAAAGSIGKGKVDYLVGSLHHINLVPIDFDQQTFELALANFSDSEEDDRGEGSDIAVKRRRRQHLRLISAYLDQQKRLIDHFQPEVIGHFDLCRLYEPLTPMTVAGLEEGEEEKDDECTNLLKQVEEKVRRNISLVVEYGGLFEINSSSIRKGWPTAYPGEDILDMILSLNGRICLSDDAHSHEQVGLNYDRARDFLTRKGVKSIWMLQRKKSASTDGVPFPRGTYAAEVEDWASHPFWSTQRPRPL